MDNSIVGAGILVAAAVVLLLSGYRIWCGDVWLIAGYRPDRVRDPASLGRAVGGGTLALGAVLLVAALAALPQVSARAVAVGTAIAIVLMVVAVLVREARRSLR